MRQVRIHRGKRVQVCVMETCRATLLSKESFTKAHGR
jgi:hypothetical protein